MAQLREENARLVRKLAAAETVIEVQKKVATLLGLVAQADPETVEDHLPPELTLLTPLARPDATTNGTRRTRSSKQHGKW